MIHSIAHETRSVSMLYNDTRRTHLKKYRNTEVPKIDARTEAIHVKMACVSSVIVTMLHTFLSQVTKTDRTPLFLPARLNTKQRLKCVHASVAADVCELRQWRARACSQAVPISPISQHNAATPGIWYI